MPRVRKHLFLAALTSTPFLVALAANPLLHDTEWPPQPDPYFDSNGNVVNNPSPGYNPELELASLHADLPTVYAGIPVGSLLTHFHDKDEAQPGTLPTGSRTSDIFTDMSIGDVDNDGEADDIVIAMAGEGLLAATLDIDWGDPDASPPIPPTLIGLEPLWAWRSPYSNGLAHVAHQGTGDDVHGSLFVRHNPLIWNVIDEGDEGDQTNEVVFIGLDENAQRRLYVFRTEDVEALTFNERLSNNEIRANPVTSSAPSGSGDQAYTLPRLAVCKVTNTDFPRDVLASEHDGDAAGIWTFINGTPVLEHRIDRTLDYNGPDSTREGNIRAKTHEFNWLDIDGDGFDEFFANGLVDLVDADASGEPVDNDYDARWQIVDSPGGRAHTDQVYVADWDPLRPGLEVLAVTEEGNETVDDCACAGWVDAAGGPCADACVLTNYDLLFDADCGTLLDSFSAGPSQNGQHLFGGNWTSSNKGIEYIASPKDSTGTVVPSGQAESTGSYAASIRQDDSSPSASFSLLAVDGSRYVDTSPDNRFFAATRLRHRSGGPFKRLWAMDWDGDYSSDEILHHPFNKRNVIIWRMGEKGDWGIQRPPGMPNPGEVEQVMNSNDMSPQTHSWDYYLDSNGDEVYQNNGPGYGTHYFQKLKEQLPPHGNGAIVARPYDIGGFDYREELVAVSTASSGSGTSLQLFPRVHVFYNSAPLHGPALDASADPTTPFPGRPSPHASLAYRQYRQSPIELPFAFNTGGVTVRRFFVRPVDGSLPRSVVGVDHGGSLVVQALIEYSDGTLEDVSPRVTWLQDADVSSHIFLDPPSSPASLDGHRTVRHVGTQTVSGRFRARLSIDGVLQHSTPLYVYASNAPEPAILRAGFEDSWIVADPNLTDRALRVSAHVAHRENTASVVQVYHPNGQYWLPYGTTTPDGYGSKVRLFDNGTHGDRIAGDGIYEISLPVPAPGWQDLQPGYELLCIRARIGFTPAQPGTPILPANRGQFRSAPWPYFVQGSGSQDAPWPIATASAMPPESLAYPSSRISSLGFRGHTDAGELLFELSVIPTPFHPAAPTTAAICIGGTWTGLLDQGGDIHTLQVSSSGIAAGLHVFMASTRVDNDIMKSSDTGPFLRLHTYPDWGLGEPSDLECSDLLTGEPSSW